MKHFNTSFNAYITCWDKLNMLYRLFNKGGCHRREMKKKTIENNVKKLDQLSSSSYLRLGNCYDDNVMVTTVPDKSLVACSLHKNNRSYLDF